jgi:membrane fusion protein, multidrug efflux system
MNFWKIVFLTGTLVLFLACGEKEAKREAGPAVRVTTVAASVQKLPSSEAYVGNVRSARSVIIATKMMGRVVRIAVQEGQAVQRGQLLVEVDAAEAQSAYEQAKAGVAATDVAVRNMEKDHERFTRLRDEKAVTQHQLEQVEMGLAAAQAQKAQAEAGVKQAQTLLSYGKILAPESGIITKKWMDPGNLAYPGAPILTLEDPADLELSVAVPEEKARALKIGQDAEVTSDSLGKRLAAKVSAVVGASDPMTRTSTVKLALPKDDSLRPGLFVSVRFAALSQESLAVPASAVHTEGQMEGVFVADAGLARLRWVQLGQRSDDLAQVLSGLKEGEAVVSPIPAGMRDGTPIEVAK